MERTEGAAAREKDAIMEMHIDGQLLIKVVEARKGAVTLAVMLRSDRPPHEIVHEWTQTLGEHDEFTLRPMQVRVGVTLSAH